MSLKAWIVMSLIAWTLSLYTGYEPESMDAGCEPQRLNTAGADDGVTPGGPDDRL